MIRVNEERWPWEEGLRLADLAAKVKPGADVLLVNGRPTAPDTPLGPGDQCILIRRGELPTSLEMNRVLCRRHSPEAQARFARALVGVMGLGGLGSAVALALARLGVGRLRLCDFDVVELSNIHRQHYFIDQIGWPKTRALKATLSRINPFVLIETIDRRLDEAAVGRLFGDVDVLVECLDDPAMKASALRTALARPPRLGYVGASGLAGFGPSNAIRTRRVRPGVFLVGDGESEAGGEAGLVASRVGVAAHHQAHQAARLLLGLEDEEVPGIA